MLRPIALSLGCKPARRPKTRTFPEEIARVVRGRAANPRWIAGMMRHGFRGAAEIAATLEHMAAFAHLAGVGESHQFDLYYDATLATTRYEASSKKPTRTPRRQCVSDFNSCLTPGYWSTRSNSAIAAIATAPAQAGERS